MSETPKNTLQENQKENFKKTLGTMLSDSNISPEEAKKLLEKFDLEKQENISISENQLQVLKAQFGEDFEVKRFKDYIEDLSKYFLQTGKPDKELLYDGITDFADFQESQKYSINLENPKKSDNISETQWRESEELLNLAKSLNITDGKISFTKENGIVLELDTTGSNLYLKISGDKIVVTGQNDGKLFVEEVSKEQFSDFVENYNRVESKRILEQIGFTGGMTLGGVLAFSLRTGIGLLLGSIGTGLGVYKGFQVFKSYNLSSNESLSVLKDLKQEPEIVKSYLYLSQVGYITGYNNGTFETIDGEKLSKDELFFKEKSFEEKDIEKYQLLRGLREKGYSPKFIESGKYEIDMDGLGDKSVLVFDENGNSRFSTNRFENGKEFEFSDVKTAFKKIQKMNECIKLETQLRNENTNSNSYNFSNNSLKIEEKINKLKQEIF